jgi:hypothetical protein
MAQISRPFQIALVVLVMFMALWFVALRGHSSSTVGSGSAPAASAPAPSSVYKGSAPGVEGLTKVVTKAHGAVATSQQNAKQLEEKSTQASSASASTASSSAAATPTAAAHVGATAKAPSATPTATATGSAGAKSAEARTGPHRTPARQALVERALHEGKIAVILFLNPKGADDVAVQEELRLLESIHHIVRPVARTTVVKSLLERSGLELQKKFAAFTARANQVTSFGSITRGIQVYSTPTLLIVNPRGQVSTLTGLQDAYSMEQAIDEARHG